MKTEIRDTWLALEDVELLRLCRVDTRRGTGPGGQKRNKTESAVQLTHLESGVSASNDVSRSQHLNKTYALKSLRLQMALKLRGDMVAAGLGEAPGVNSDNFFLWVAHALDILESVDYRVSEAAGIAGLSTSKFTRALAKAPALLQKVNSERVARGMNNIRI